MAGKEDQKLSSILKSLRELVESLTAAFARHSTHQCQLGVDEILCEALEKLILKINLSITASAKPTDLINLIGMLKLKFLVRITFVC